MVYKYFLLVCGLYFHFLNGIFLKAKFLNVDIVYQLLLLLLLLFVSYLRNLCLT